MDVRASERLDRELREFQRQAAVAKRAAEEARTETSAVRGHLLVIETELARALQAVARERNDLEELERERKTLEAELGTANETIQGMQTTRVWRLGTGYWRLRDRLLRRD